MRYVHDPQAKLDYGFDWAAEPPGPWLATGETIVTSTWTVSPAGELILSLASHDATTTTIWAEGGIVNKVYRVTNHIVTSDGRADDRYIELLVRDR